MKSPAPTPGRAKRTTFLSLGRGGFCLPPSLAWPHLRQSPRRPGLGSRREDVWLGGKGEKEEGDTERKEGKRETETGWEEKRVSNENERQRHKMGGDMDRQTTNKDQA